MIERLMPGIPFVVSIGNHDFEPANYQEFKEKNSEYLGNLAKIWESSFLGQEQALKKFKEFGFFALDAPAPLSDQ